MGKRYNSYNQKADFYSQNDRDRNEYVDDREEDFERKHRERNIRDFRKERRSQKEQW